MPTRRLLPALMLLAAVLFAMPARANPMLLVDMSTLEVLYEEDAGQPWHPASLTKLMTAFVTFEAIAAGEISLDSPVTISANANRQAPSVSGLKIGAAVTLRDALYILIVKSANDIAVAIAEAVGGTEAAFVERMNATAKRMGLTATHYVNPNGLHNPGQVTSARDLAVLSLYIRQLYPQYANLFATETVTMGKAKMETNNNLMTKFAGTDGMKTGFVCASGLNIVATVNRNGRSLMAVVLGGSSARERGEMAAEMFLRGFSGALGGTGRSVLTIANRNAPPVDMRPILCGSEAKAYVAGREKAYPFGLKGQPSYLTDAVHGLSYSATDLGVIRTGVPLPRPRPAHMPIHVAATTPVALPAPSPAGDGGLATPTYPPRAPLPLPKPRPGLQLP